jgi:hypothetical protein
MPEIKLPNSKLKVRIGVMNYLITKQPFWDMVFIQIMKSHQLQDKIEGKDPEVQWSGSLMI